MSTMRPGQDRNERTLGQLVASATQDFSTIIRGEIALAKAELSSQFKKAGMGGALLAAAGVVGFYSVYFIFITIAEGITAAGLPKWLSYLIVTVFFLLVAGILALLGVRRLRSMQPKPTKAVAEAELTVAALKRATSNPYNPNGSRAVVAGTASPAAAATTPTQAAHAAPVSASSAPGIAAGSPEARLADARTAEARAAAPGRPAPAAPLPGTTTTSTHGWEETASDAVASGTGVEGPADLTDHPVMSSAPGASTAALPRTRAEAKAQAEAEAKAHEDAKAHADGKRRDTPEA